jgi:glycerol-3-phosphate dehydrogenase (NAD(P)+)
LPNKAITVLGAGSWGTALAILLARRKVPVTLWGRDEARMEEMRQQRCNSRYLPNITFPEGLELTSDLKQAVTAVSHILVAVPSHCFRATLEAINPFLHKDSSLAWATKGLEHGTHKLLHVVATEVLGDAVPKAVVSGPTFAKEVAQGLPAAVTVASSDTAYAEQFAAWLHGGNFRAYTSDDIVGVEIGGATKNVLAIAAGITDGLGFGANTRAALISRGLAEMMRLGVAMGGQRETFMGLTGLGDLVLTCTDNQSRNRRFGLALGQGKTAKQATDEINQVIEGVQTASEIYQLSQEMNIDMPITEQVYRVLFENRNPKEAVKTLLEREQKPENG